MIASSISDVAETGFPHAKEWHCTLNKNPLKMGKRPKCKT
jgi:hypothetical protein